MFIRNATTFMNNNIVKIIIVRHCIHNYTNKEYYFFESITISSVQLLIVHFLLYICQQAHSNKHDV